MRLYSSQPLFIYERLMRGESWTANPFADPENELADSHWKSAYDWLGRQMHARGQIPQDATTAYPVWAWYQWAGTSQPKPDLRYSSMRDYARNGNTQVLLTLDIPDDRVLLSDYDAWHWVLNNWYFGDEAQDDLFTERCKAAGANYRRQAPLEDAELQAEMEASWVGIFDMEKAAVVIESTVDKAIIQATFWELRPEDVVGAVQFEQSGKTQRLPHPDPRRDEDLFAAKRKIQEQSRADIRDGRYSQTDAFLVRPEVARRAIVTLKA